jgi:predicted RecA/RadA family phage recombinase
MKNFVQPGENVTLPAPAAVNSGELIRVGNLFGVASYDAAISADVVLVTEGVFELPKIATDALAVGDPVYWRSSDGLVAGTASGNTKIGVAILAAPNPSGTVRVRLNGSF